MMDEEHGKAGSAGQAAIVQKGVLELMEASEMIRRAMDRLWLYRYALLRLWLSRQESASFPVFDVERTADQLLGYIMEGKNSGDTCHRVHQVVECLPVNFTKSRLFRILEETFCLEENAAFSEKEKRELISRLRSRASLLDIEMGFGLEEQQAGLLLELKERDFSLLTGQECEAYMKAAEESFEVLKKRAGRIHRWISFGNRVVRRSVERELLPTVSEPVLPEGEAEFENVREEFFLSLEQRLKRVRGVLGEAIMARTLSALPRCFETLEEVEEYITSSLLLCADRVEQEACRQETERMMVEEDALL